MNEMIQNPIQSPAFSINPEMADPFLMRFDGRYYLYCTAPASARGIRCWVSEDMTRFTYWGLVCEDSRVFGAFAPEVCYMAGSFYMVTSPCGNGHYLLRADSPTGPFEVIGDNFGLTIDGSIFQDDDGGLRFYRAGTDGIHVHDMPAPHAVNRHGRTIPDAWLGHWTEGPMVVKRDGRYFLTLTGNHYLSRGYRVEYRVSRQGPDRGFRRLRDAALLLETREEAHALGHSCTCVGPDMDTMYLVYHNNRLDAWNRPDHRSMNVDRLFFNGDRMYAGATWWPQCAPKAPDCQCRGGDGMREHRMGRALPMETGADYTAEICLTLRAESGHVFFSWQTSGGVMTLRRGGEWALTIDGEDAALGRLPKTIAPDALMCVRVSLRGGALCLAVNGLTVYTGNTRLRGGQIGLDAQSAPSFVAFSGVSQGSGDYTAAKPVPGAFDAVHALQPAARQAEGESGCMAARLAAGEELSYAINVWRAGDYHMSVTLRADRQPLALCVNGQRLVSAFSGGATPDGMEKRYMGVILLKAGKQTLSLHTERAVTLDRICLAEAGALPPQALIADGRDATGGQLRILGGKADGSMMRKGWGFTCSEGYGAAYFGGDAHNQTLRAVLALDPASEDAAACLYLRSNRESWHFAQVNAARIAYCVRITRDEIGLYRQEYAQELLAARRMALSLPARLTLVAQAAGNRISVWRENAGARELLLTAIDPMAIPCGHVGLDAQGDGIGFEAVSLIEDDLFE